MMPAQQAGPVVALAFYLMSFPQNEVLSQALQRKCAKSWAFIGERKVGAQSGVSQLSLQGPDGRYLSCTDQEAKLRIKCWVLHNHLKCNHFRKW